MRFSSNPRLLLSVPAETQYFEFWKSTLFKNSFSGYVSISMENIRFTPIRLQGNHRFSWFPCFGPTLLETTFPYNSQLEPLKTYFFHYKRWAVTITIAPIWHAFFEQPSTFALGPCWNALFRFLEIVDVQKQVFRFRIDFPGNHKVFENSPQVNSSKHKENNRFFIETSKPTFSKRIKTARDQWKTPENWRYSCSNRCTFIVRKSM
jgi:hypothetical protein